MSIAVGEESEGDVCQGDGVQFKFSDGQPVTLEDGSTAYVLSRYKGAGQLCDCGVSVAHGTYVSACLSTS